MGLSGADQEEKPSPLHWECEEFLSPTKKEGAEAFSPRLQEEPNCLLKPQPGEVPGHQGSGELGRFSGSGSDSP